MNLVKIISIITLVLLSYTSSAEVAVIVNSNNADVIDQKLVKRIYLGKVKSFSNKTKITVLSLKDDNAATADFRQKALKKSNSQYKSYWSKLAFTGKGTPPKEMTNDAEMVNAVKANPAAIGFVDSAAVTSDVKVIARY